MYYIGVMPRPFQMPSIQTMDILCTINHPLPCCGTQLFIKEKEKGIRESAAPVHRAMMSREFLVFHWMAFSNQNVSGVYSQSAVWMKVILELSNVKIEPKGELGPSSDARHDNPVVIPTHFELRL